MLQSTKRAGASPQQHCEFQTNQTQKMYLSHSQLCHWLFPRRKRMVWTHSQFVQNGIWAGAAPQQRCELQNEQGLHPSNIVNNKTSRKFTTATLRDSKRARAAPQQHCELRNEQELHHVKIVNYKTSRSCTTATQQRTMLARAAPQQHCESKRNRVVGQIINLLKVEFNLNTFWIHFQIQQSRLCHLVIRAGLPAVDTPTSI